MPLPRSKRARPAPPGVVCHGNVRSVETGAGQGWPSANHEPACRPAEMIARSRPGRSGTPGRG